MRHPAPALHVGDDGVGAGALRRYLVHLCLLRGAFLFPLRLGLDFLRRPWCGCGGLGLSILAASNCGELRLERLVGRRLRIVRIERRADILAVGELAQNVGRIGRLLVEVDGAADARERDAADAGVTRKGDNGIGHRQFVGGKLGRIGIVKARRRIVRRIEAVGRHVLQEAAGLLGARDRLAGRQPERREVAAL